MTNEEVSEACKKFCDYLRANGRRPTAMVMKVCDDRRNGEEVVHWGIAEEIDETCLAMLAQHRGFALAHR